MKHPLLLALLCATVLAAPAGGPIDFSASPSSTLRYTVKHEFHTIVGTSHSVTARARILPDGTAQFMARAPVASFDSGNGNRDEHMQEAVDAKAFPFIEVKAVGSGVKMPTSFPATVSVPLQGTVTLHGVTQPLSTTVTLAFSDARHATGEAHFPISMTAFHIDRPSLAFIKVDDEVQIDAQLFMERKP